MAGKWEAGSVRLTAQLPQPFAVLKIQTHRLLL